MQVHCSPHPLQFLVLLAIPSSLFIAIRTRLMPQTLTFMCFLLWCFLPFPLPSFVHLDTSFKTASSFTLLYQPIPEASKVYFLHHLIYKFPFSNSNLFPSKYSRNSDHVLRIPLWVSLWLDMKTILLQVFNNLSFYLD